MSGDIQDVGKILREVVRMREEDIGDFDNLQNIFMRGRKVGKTPTSSTDTAVTDREGDFNYSATYFYLCINNAGTIAWRRIALAVW